MRFVGIDLHKRSLTVCVFDRNTSETFDRRFLCVDEGKISDFFKGLGPFAAVIEATASYEWLWLLLEPLASRLVLAHPKKIRIIAESMKKSDRHDAYFLAWLLAMDSVPAAHRPSPHQREYQQLVKHRCNLVRSRSRLKTKIRSILAAKNLDAEGLFKEEGLAAVDLRRLSGAEVFCLEELLEMLQEVEDRVERAMKRLVTFRSSASPTEKKIHSLVTSVPGVGDLVADIVLSTLGDLSRFRNVSKCTAYAGIVPGFRESDTRRHDLGITKEGPRLLRWALVQSAWRAIQFSRYWRAEFDKLAARRGKKKAIVAVARRLLATIYALVRKGEPYREKPLSTPPTTPRNENVRISA